MKIAELAERVGVPTSTVRYYERIGLLPEPERTPAGYRDYGDDAAARLLFVTRARRMGLSCQQITELLPIWNETNCATTQQRVGQLIVDKQAELAERIAELQAFLAQLESVRVAIDRAQAPDECRADLSCCVPSASNQGPIPIEIDDLGRSRRTR